MVVVFEQHPLPGLETRQLRARRDNIAALTLFGFHTGLASPFLMTPPKIILNAVRQEDLDNGRPDYHIMANGYLVGRIYRTNQTNENLWLWSVACVWTSAESGITMHGNAPTLEAAQAIFREAFDKWLEWILTIPSDHLSFRTIDEQLRKIGARR